MKPLMRALILCLLLLTPAAAEMLDSIQFGNAENENAHGLAAADSTIITGATDMPARQLLPTRQSAWRGGSLTFRMKVDPAKPNYFTAVFWGGDLTGQHSRLTLFIEGKQVGQRHLGEVDLLDIMYQYPRYPGNFFYKTQPLPEGMTKGKSSVELRIEAQGPIWGYGPTIQKYQQEMKVPSRGIYGGFVHTDPYFAGAAKDPRAMAVAEFPIRPKPGPEVMDAVKKKLNGQIAGLLKSRGRLPMDAIRFLAKGCLEPWCDAYHNKAALERLIEGIDSYYHDFVKDPAVVEKEWHGYGPVADAVRLLPHPLRNYLDGTIEGTDVVRRDGWAEMFARSRDRKVTQRRFYTNQSMIVDMGIYQCNRAVAVLDPSRAWPERKALVLLRESAGVEPWSGSWDARGTPSWTRGRSHMLFTAEGLTRELGYVGHYGEIVIGMLLEAYEASRPSRKQPGDPKLRAQLVKMTRARGVFRYPLPDGDGYRSMHIETVIGWRDWYYPGGTTYEQMWSEAPLDVAAATLDPALIGYGQQMLGDNQYFKSLEKRMELRGYGPMTRLLDAPGNLETVMAQPEQTARLPMAPGQPDFVFTDPEIGVVALKNGEEILYTSLYWRARYAINNLARVHHLTPNVERDATVRIQTRFQESGQFYEMPDRTDQPFSNRNEGFYKGEGMYLATAGEEQPIAKVPADQKDFEPGKENPYAGKGEFYVMEYGPYLIAMNCTKGMPYALAVPEKFAGAKDLVSGQTAASANLTVPPWRTVVLFRR